MKFIKNLFVKTYAGCMKSFCKTLKDLEEMIEQRNLMMEDIHDKIELLEQQDSVHADEIDKALKCTAKLKELLGG